MAALYPSSHIHAVCVLYAYEYCENVIIHYGFNAFVWVFLLIVLCAVGLVELHSWSGFVGSSQRVKVAPPWSPSA